MPEYFLIKKNLLKEKLWLKCFELCEIFYHNFFASDCFSKYESLWMTVAGYSCKVVLKIFGTNPGAYLHRIASFVKLQVPQN